MSRRSMVPVLVSVLLLAACGSSEVADPEDVLNDYVEAYNAGDLDGVMSFFAEDAVVTRHPAGEATGREAIREIHGEVGSGVSYTVTVQEVSGDTIMWDHVWHSGDGDNCVDGHIAVVTDGVFVRWDWPVTDFDCHGSTGS